MVSITDLHPWVIKLVGTILMFLLSMIFGAIPLKLSRDENEPPSRLRNLLISLCNCFAGGVFFSTVVLDLIPMVLDKTKDALQSVNSPTAFPLGEFVIGLGFILMLIMEQFVHSCCKNTFLSHPGHSHEVNDDPFPPQQYDQLLDDDEDDHNGGDRGKLLTPTSGIINTASPVDGKHVTVGHTSVLHGNSISESELEQSQRSFASVYSGDTYYSENGTRHHMKAMRRTKSLASMQSVTHSNFRTYILVFAISLHSLFEGLAVGLTTDNKILLNIFLGLLIHKSIIAFSIGVQLVDADFKSKVVLMCLGIFALMAPLGVGLGVVVLDGVHHVAKKFFSCILQAIATGSFLYVTFFEVLPHELNIEDDKKPLKILFVLFGYFVTTGICYYEQHITQSNGGHPNSTTISEFY